jgi:hypothetical protein
MDRKSLLPTKYSIVNHIDGIGSFSYGGNAINRLVDPNG